ncbi:MAG: tetratricopeptide repeat protein [Alphaproteobacteria bacterium]|nr:MAG: tetratricopeptide repeat protein [Alphaproteobacteria bacterium]
MNRTERRKSAKSEKARIDENIQNGLGLMQAGQFGGAERVFRNVLSVQPRNAEALYRLGTISLLARRYDEAEDLFRRSLMVRPKEADVHNDLAYTIQQIGKVGEALKEYETAMDLDPSRVVYKTNYAALLMRIGRHQEAEAVTDGALLVDPKDSRALFLKGMLCKSSDREDEAMDAYEAAIEANPILREAHLNLSELKFQKEGGESFIDSYKSMYEADKTDPRRALLYTEALHKSGRYDELEKVLRPFLETEFAKHPGILNGLAYGLASQGNFDEAIELHKQALQVAHNDPVTHHNYGRTLVQMGDYRNAIEQFRQVAQVLPFAQDMLALSSTAFTQINDPQGDVLNDRERLIFETRFEPEGEDLASYHTKVVSQIDSLPEIQVHPFDQPRRLSSVVRQGVLTDEGDGVLAGLTKFFGNGIADFVEATPDNNQHPFLAVKRAGITGVANVYSETSEFGRLNFPAQRNGLMRGFYFIDVPQECDDETQKAGWLHFGEPDMVMKDKIEADFEIKPEAGKLVLFPAYMWHGFNALKAKTPMRVLSLLVYGTQS